MMEMGAPQGAAWIDLYMGKAAGERGTRALRRIDTQNILFAVEGLMGENLGLLLKNGVAMGFAVRHLKFAVVSRERMGDGITVWFYIVSYLIACHGSREHEKRFFHYAGSHTEPR